MGEKKGPKKLTPTPGVTADGWVSIGVLAKAHGIKGAIKMHPWNDEAGDVIEAGLHLRVGTSDRRVTRYASKILELEGLSDRNEAEKLMGQEVLVRREDFPAHEEDALYLVDLVGAPVFHENGAALGSVTGISDNGAQPLLMVQTTQGEVLVPYVDAFVREATHERIVLAPPQGLFNDDAIIDDEGENSCPPGKS